MADYTEKQANASRERIYRAQQARMDEAYRADPASEAGARCEAILEGVDDLMGAGEYETVVGFDRGDITFDDFAAAVVATRRRTGDQVGGLADWTMTIG